MTDYILDTNIVSGVTKLAPSQRLVDWLAAQDDQGGRILSFDSRAALEWAELMAEGDRKERPRSAIDMMIAAVARANDCVVVTGNARDFAGVEVFNPLN